MNNPFVTVYPVLKGEMAKKILSAADAGALIKKKRQERQLTQEQLVERVKMSSQNYLSSFENGKFHIGRSEYFADIARELGLTEEEIRMINPDIIFSQTPGEKPRLPLAHVQQISITQPTRGDVQLSPVLNLTLVVNTEEKSGGLLIYEINQDIWIFNPDSPVKPSIEPLGTIVEIDFN